MTEHVKIIDNEESECPGCSNTSKEWYLVDDTHLCPTCHKEFHRIEEGTEVCNGGVVT